MATITNDPAVFWPMPRNSCCLASGRSAIAAIAALQSRRLVEPKFARHRGRQAVSGHLPRTATALRSQLEDGEYQGLGVVPGDVIPCRPTTKCPTSARTRSSSPPPRFSPASTSESTSTSSPSPLHLHVPRKGKIGRRHRDRLRQAVLFERFAQRPCSRHSSPKSRTPASACSKTSPSWREACRLRFALQTPCVKTPCDQLVARPGTCSMPPYRRFCSAAARLLVKTG